ncbi:DUF2938 family protein [Pseudooceanicola sp. GBMRC 2024]|uniref:DUF2938 family protein n=1 Tax=Pseudooceanicola albus TaxID=2692189 RepID=A0A6L7GCW5_9RHOB|nr:DUF2938 family protein [Pseudooceanicola albus]
MPEILRFILIVGIGATVALDLWAVVMARIGWMPGTHWPAVGRWLLGLRAGRLVLEGTDSRPYSLAEAVLGWLFHYLIGLGYAAAFPLIWGTGFLSAPTVFPVVLIGIVVSSLAGLMILMPAMGGGLFARRLPGAGGVILYVLIAHAVFALAQYLLALLLA